MDGIRTHISHTLLEGDDEEPLLLGLIKVEDRSLELRFLLNLAGDGPKGVG